MTRPYDHTHPSLWFEEQPVTYLTTHPRGSGTAVERQRGREACRRGRAEEHCGTLSCVTGAAFPHRIYIPPHPSSIQSPSLSPTPPFPSPTSEPAMCQHVRLTDRYIYILHAYIHVRPRDFTFIDRFGELHGRRAPVGRAAVHTITHCMHTHLSNRCALSLWCAHVSDRPPSWSSRLCVTTSMRNSAHGLCRDPSSRQQTLWANSVSLYRCTCKLHTDLTDLVAHSGFATPPCESLALEEPSCRQDAKPHGKTVHLMFNSDLPPPDPAMFWAGDGAG